MLFVPVTARAPERLIPLAGRLPTEKLQDSAERLRARLHGRVVWNVSSTAAGGGVPEVIRSLVSYARGFGIDARWVVLEGPREFFLVVKALRRLIYGLPAYGRSLDAHARKLYEEVLRENAVGFLRCLRPGDVALLHDPQTAGLIPHVVDAGALAVWRSYIGADSPNEQTERGWAFLEPYLEAAHGHLFTSGELVPGICDPACTGVMPAALDPFSPKNQELSPEAIRSILVHAGIVEGPAVRDVRGFIREDGTPGRVDRSADVIRLGRGPSWDTPLVVQVSRWDSLKDPVGVLRGFANLLERGRPSRAELVLAGPSVHAVADDPEGACVFEEVLHVWRALPHGERRRIHLVHLPMGDPEENAVIVNALQRHASVIVQKSLHAGVGLSVTEAMWKQKAVVASSVAGIRDQIDHGVSGLLTQDPRNLEEFSETLGLVVDDPDLASVLGRAAREHVRERVLGAESVDRWSALLVHLDGIAAREH